MKLLQKYPWLIPNDGHEWVPVEATPIVVSATEAYHDVMQHQKRFNMPVRPPWPRCIIEYTSPKDVRSRWMWVLTHVTDPESVAKIVSGMEHQDGAQWRDGIPGDVTTTEAVVAHLFFSAVREKPEFMAQVFWGLNEGLPYWYASRPASRFEGGGKEVQGIILYSAYNVLSTLAFLNCKNVTVEDEPVPPKVREKRAKKGADIIYKQLVVDGHPVTRRPGNESQEDADRRYHICRGHFADHREHGLFGKHSLRGIYWVPMHARGSRHNGEVIKDYIIKPNEQSSFASA